MAFIEDLSIVRIKSPEERLQVGQKIKCMIKSVDEQTGRINLSYKDCLGTWDENIQSFKEGMTVKGIVRDPEKNKNGIFIELTPNLVGMTEYTEKNISRLEITIHEGKNRQVRKMCEAVGRRVLALHRSKIGNIGVKDLELGKWRYLKKEEIEQL